MKRILMIGAASVLSIAAVIVSAQQPELTDRQRVEQARALLLPLDATLDGAARTNLRNITTRLLTLLGQLPDDTLPPAPIDCEISDWTLTETAFGVCQPAGTRTRTETWVRTIVRDAEHGGAACPSPLPSEQRTFSEPCDYVPPPPSPTGDHGYFDSLRKRPEHLASWSLRDQAQLDALTADKRATFWSYDPVGDPYPQKQDAAKLYVPAGLPSANLPTKQQLRMPLPRVDSGSLLVTWDWYWGPEFRTQRGGMNHYKVFKFHLGGHSIWTLMHSPSWSKTDDEVAKIWDSFATPSGPPDGLVTREPITPAGLGTPDQRNKSGEQVGIYPHVWMRYWVEWRLFQPHTAFTEWNQVTGQTLRPNPNDPEGRWHMVSLWFADEHRGPMRLLYRIPVGWAANWSPHISEFDFLMNTSQTSGFIGPWVGYGRNVVVLRDVSLAEGDTTIFQRPAR